MFHVELHTGGTFSGDVATLLDLTEEQVRERILDKREAGDPIWAQGKEFPWNETTSVRIFEGPPTPTIPDFSAILGLTPFEASGVMQERTDDFITGPPGGLPPTGGQQTSGTEVFIVHGSDPLQEAVARFLERMLPVENETVILHEQPNRGQTLLEKFEASAADARYAVVLLTADDEGRQRGEDECQPRARQNVVFELGFFIAKLGRPHVAVLYEPGVELPSDLSGLVYIELGDEGWKLKLAKEMKDSGLEIDLNRL